MEIRNGPIPPSKTPVPLAVHKRKLALHKNRLHPSEVTAINIELQAESCIVSFIHSNAASESLVYAGMLLVSCQTSIPASVPRRARLTCDGKWVKPTYQLL